MTAKGDLPGPTQALNNPMKTKKPRSENSLKLQYDGKSIVLPRDNHQMPPLKMR
jgi:hypothetical protein